MAKVTFNYNRKGMRIPNILKLNFKIRFKKGIAGIENDLFRANAIGNIFCNDCGIDFKKGDVYYYWIYDDLSDEASPTTEESEYLLCPKCANKKR